MIGERLLKLRRERKMNQNELAKILSLSKYSVSLYENNKSIPSEETFVKIARTFDISIDYLMGMIDEPYSYRRDSETVIRIPNFLPISVKEAVYDFAEFLQKKHQKSGEL